MMKIRRFIPVFVTALLLMAIVYMFREKVSVTRLLENFAGADVRYLTLSAIFFSISSMGSVARYKFVVDRSSGSRVSFTYLFLISNFSYACGYFAPVGAAGDILRIAFMRRDLAVGYAKSTRLIVLDRVMAVAGVALLSLLFIPLKLAYDLNRDLIVAEGIACAAFFVLLLGMLQAGPWMFSRITVLSLFQSAVLEDRAFIQSNMSSLRSIAIVMACTIVAVGGFGLGAILVAAAMGFEPDLWSIFVASPTIVLAQSAPIFYAGFGAREAVMLVAYQGAAHADPNVVLSLSLTIGVMIFIATLPPSTFFVVQEARRRAVGKWKCPKRK